MSKREIDLSGPDGNAHSLMGIARMWGKQIGLDTKAIINDMMSGNYEHLLDVFEEQFGDYVELINRPGENQEEEE